jgi:hypothetical protein
VQQLFREREESNRRRNNLKNNHLKRPKKEGEEVWRMNRSFFNAPSITGKKVFLTMPNIATNSTGTAPPTPTPTGMNIVSFFYRPNSNIIDSETDNSRVIPRTTFDIPIMDVGDKIEVSVDGIEYSMGPHYTVVGNSIVFTSQVAVDSEIIGEIYKVNTSSPPPTTDVYYLHTQSTPSITWDIVHNLNKYADVIAIVGGVQVTPGNIDYNFLGDGLNKVRLEFDMPVSGIAILD